jgi:hypothetical protein
MRVGDKIFCFEHRTKGGKRRILTTVDRILIIATGMTQEKDKIFLVVDWMVIASEPSIVAAD